jgi:hypothetical protein
MVMTRFLLSLVLAFALCLALGLDGVASAADPTTETSGFQKYPPEAVDGLYKGCSKAKDLPADKVKAVCSCYTVLVQVDVPYSVFAKTNAQLKAKGFDGLDADGKATMEKNANAAAYCRLKDVAADATEERGTFPASALPALHESCMNFSDVPTDKRQSFCGCYEQFVRTKITYSDWRLLSLAIATKGVEHLDGQETGILGAVREVRQSCAATK